MITCFWPSAIFFVIWFCHIVSSEKNQILKPGINLPKNYSKEYRPSEKGRPVVIKFGIYIVDITSINVEAMDFRVDMYLRQTWRENRLQLPNNTFDEEDQIPLSPEFFKKLWHPDPYFVNSKITEIAHMTNEFSSVVLLRNKTLRYSTKIYALITCHMEFQLYPMDVQSCPIYIESFSYNTQKLLFHWGKDGVIINPDSKLLQYRIGQPLRLEETKEYMYDKNGNYSRLVVYIRYERQIGHHLIQTFAPSSLVVMLSWFSFWLELDAIPARVALLITCMLTLVTMFTGLRATVPPVAYVKALDLWMATCMIFIFAALGEFVVVKVLDRQNQINNAKEKEATKNIPMATRRDAESGGQERILWKEIDKFSRIIFPALFLLFLILYWSILFLKSIASI